MRDEFICCKECGNKTQHCTCKRRRVSDSSQPACSVFRICEHCNKEYEVPLERAGNSSKDWICNFTDCPHCGKRDDVWILIKPNATNEPPRLGKDSE